MQHANIKLSILLLSNVNRSAFRKRTIFYFVSIRCICNKYSVCACKNVNWNKLGALLSKMQSNVLRVIT